MACWTRKEAEEHYGHKVEVACYGQVGDPESVTIKCTYCYEVLVAFEDLEDPDRNVPNWERNDYQFPRLLSEIMASGCLTEEAWNTLLASMDLESNQLKELFNRAQTAWEQIVADTCPVDSNGS